MPFTHPRFVLSHPPLYLLPFLHPPRFVLSHPLVASAVIGATGSGQLEELIRAAEAGPLGEEVLARIDEVHARLPNPTP